MEKLELQKFEGYKLDNKELSYIHAGDVDTFGGWLYEVDGSNHHEFRYDSDYINSSGAIHYNNFRYSHSWSSMLGNYHDEFVSNQNSF